jgi:hypothetical protein
MRVQQAVEKCRLLRCGCARHCVKLRRTVGARHAVPLQNIVRLQMRIIKQPVKKIFQQPTGL